MGRKKSRDNFLDGPDPDADAGEAAAEEAVVPVTKPKGKKGKKGKAAAAFAAGEGSIGWAHIAAGIMGKQRRSASTATHSGSVAVLPAVDARVSNSSMHLSPCHDLGLVSVCTHNGIAVHQQLQLHAWHPPLPMRAFELHCTVTVTRHTTQRVFKLISAQPH